MQKRQKYKMWRISDFHLVEELMKSDHSIEEIAKIMNITCNALYKALKRRKIYSQIVCPVRTIEVCSVSDVYKIADNLRIDKSGGIVNILSKINISRQNTELPRIILR